MVTHGAYSFDPETSYYKILIGLGDEGELVQSVMKETDAKKMLALIDECIAVREERITLAMDTPDE